MTKTVSGVEVDFEGWPTVCLRPVEKVSPREMQEFMDFWQGEMAHRKGSHGLLLDLTRLVDMTAQERKILMDGIRDKKGDIQRERVACAMVFRSRVLATILNLVMRFNRPEYPVMVFTSEDAARGWLAAMLSAQRAG